jgi:hypothetical protein
MNQRLSQSISCSTAVEPPYWVVWIVGVPHGGKIHYYPIGINLMFRIPGTTLQVRMFDRVETKDDQYDVFDIGFQYDDGGIDSVVVGGSFYTAKQLFNGLDQKGKKKAKKKVAKAEKQAAKQKRKADIKLAAETALAEKMAASTPEADSTSELSPA